MAITLDNVSLLGFYDFGSEDVVIGDVTLSNAYSEDLHGASTHSFAVDDQITQFPPTFAGSGADVSDYQLTEDDVSSTSGYKWLEIRTLGNITIQGVIDATSGGFIGGPGNDFNAYQVFNTGKGARDGSGPSGGGKTNASTTGGYLDTGTNSDPFDEKSYDEVLAFGGGRNWGLQRNRNIVYPGSGGSGGALPSVLPDVPTLKSSAIGGAGAGGCGGGIVRLIGASSVVFESSAKVITRGSADGGDGTAGFFTVSNANCDFGLAPETHPKACVGVHIVCADGLGFWLPAYGSPNNWLGRWSSGIRGYAGRNRGNSLKGNTGACCHSFHEARRCWNNCSSKVAQSGYSSDIWHTPEGRCYESQNGSGGAGGGVFISSSGQISLTENNVDLRGYIGRSNGGTLKIFHVGLLSDGILDLTDATKPSTNLKQKIGGFYSEKQFTGYSTGSGSTGSGSTGSGDTSNDGGVNVPSLTSVASNYKSGEERFQITFNEGPAYVPNGIGFKHRGFDVYRAVNYDAATSFYEDGGSQPPPMDDTKWQLIGSVPYSNSSNLGPQNILSPSHNQSATDEQGRTWVYSDGTDFKFPAWYLNSNETYDFTYTDSSIYDYLMTTVSPAKTLTEAKAIVQDVLYAKKGLWYWVRSKFELNGSLLDTETALTTATAGRPTTTDPSFEINFDVVESTPFEFSSPSIDGRVPNTDRVHIDKFYDSRKNSEGNFAVGYDDLTVAMETPTYWGSFKMSSWDADWDFADATDAIETNTMASVSAGTPREVESTVNNERTFSTPTQEGRIQTRPSTSDPLGYKMISVTAFYNDNCYDLTYPNTITNSNSITSNGNVIIQEREPTPVFYLSAVDAPSGRSPMSVGDNTVSKYFSYEKDNYNIVFSRIVSAFESGVDIHFTDQSISRTFPISSWTIHYDKNDSSFYQHTTSANVENADSQMLNTTILPSAVYSDPGVYYVSLVLEASGTTTGFDLSAINRLYVYPLAPTAQFTNEFSSNEQTVSAFVPIYFKATDQSIPSVLTDIETWNWDLYDGLDRTQISDTYTLTSAGEVLEHNWRWHTENYELSNVTVDASLNNFCLDARTPSYGRRGRTDAYGTTALFIDDDPIYSNGVLCESVYLYERPPVPQLSVVSAFTYTSAFSEDSPSYDESIAYVSAGSVYVSGYAPFVNVVFEDRSTPKSYPISAFEWNYGDYFNDTSNVDTLELSAGASSSGWEYPFPTDHGVDGSENYPEWTTSLTEHQVEHTFTAPGTYDVTLTVSASSTNTQRSQNMTVEVIELLPTCDFSASVDQATWYDLNYLSPLSSGVTPLSGTSQLNVYFTPSGIVAGSYPIGRLLWDFGDGSDVLEIDRYKNNYNNQPFGSDPRGFNGGVVSHTYERQYASEADTFTVNLSVVTDISNTLLVCSSIEIGPVKLPSFGGDVHLIKNRNLEDNSDNLYVLQRESDNSLFNIVLSG